MHSQGREHPISIAPAAMLDMLSHCKKKNVRWGARNPALKRPGYSQAVPTGLSDGRGAGVERALGLYGALNLSGSFKGG